MIAKSIHHIQPGKPDENGVRRLFKFADLVQNEHFYEAKVYGKDRPTFVYLRGKKGIYTYWLSPDLKVAKKLPKNCTVIEENGLGVLCLTSSYAATRSKKEKLQFFSEQGKVTWTSPIFVNNLSLSSVYYSTNTRLLIFVYSWEASNSKDIIIASEEGVIQRKPLSQWSLNSREQKSLGKILSASYDPENDEIGCLLRGSSWLKITLSNMHLEKKKYPPQRAVYRGKRYKAIHEVTQKRTHMLTMYNNNSSQKLWSQKKTPFIFRKFWPSNEYFLLAQKKTPTSKDYEEYVYVARTGEKASKRRVLCRKKSSHGLGIEECNGIISTITVESGKLIFKKYHIGRQYNPIHLIWKYNKSIYFDLFSPQSNWQNRGLHTLSTKRKR